MNENPSMVVSITSHGPRVQKLDRVLIPLVENAEAAGAVVSLTLHTEDTGSMTSGTIGLVMSGKIRLLVAGEDFGSNLKYIYAMREYQDVPVMVHDDDVVFPPSVFRELAGFSASHPGTIGARRVRKMLWDSPGVPHRFPTGYLKYTSCSGFTKPEPTVDCFPEGCSGIVFPAGCFSDFVDNRSVLEEVVIPCKHDDDVALRVMAARKGLTTMIVPTSGNLLDVDFYGNPKKDQFVGTFVHDDTIRETSLWRNGGGGRRTTEALSRFGKELWDFALVEKRRFANPILHNM